MELKKDEPTPKYISDLTPEQAKKIGIKTENIGGKEVVVSVQKPIPQPQKGPVFTEEVARGIAGKERRQSMSRADIERELQRSSIPSVEYEVTPTTIKGYREGVKILEAQRQIPQPEQKKVESKYYGGELGFTVPRRRSDEETPDVAPTILTPFEKEQVMKGDVRGVQKPVREEIKWYEWNAPYKYAGRAYDDLTEWLKQKEFQAQYRTPRGAEYSLANLMVFGVGVGKGFVTPFVKPVETAKGLVEFPIQLITKPAQTLKGFTEMSPSEVGEFTGTVLFFESLPRIWKAGKNVYVKAGAEYVEPTKFFGKDVLEGKKKFETARSVQESLGYFKEASRDIPVKGYERLTVRDIGKKGLPKDYYVATPFEYGKIEYVGPTRRQYIKLQTSSPEIIGDGISEYSKKAKLGLEDPGVYLSPKGKGMTAFLRLAQEGYGPYDFTLNPFKGLFDLPTVSEFTRKGIKRYPREVIEKPGFEAIAEYQKRVAGEGYVYLTKRSELALGGVKRQRFFNEVSGKWEWEKGSPEVEAVEPIGSPIKFKAKSTLGRLKGFDYYTTIEGINIPIRKSKQLTRAKVRGKIVEEPFIGVDEISPKQLGRESEYFYSQFEKKRSPYDLSKISNIKGRVSSSFAKPKTLSSWKGYSYVRKPVYSYQKFQESIYKGIEKGKLSSMNSYLEYSQSKPSEIIKVGSSIVRGGESSIIDAYYPNYYPPGTPSRPPTYYPPKSPPRTPKRTKPISYPQPKKDKERKNGYDVFARHGGKFLKLNKEGKLSRDQALRLGERAVDETTARTFKIMQGKRKPDVGLQEVSGELRRKKGNDRNIFVEKSAYAIDTRGELQGITVKGWNAKRLKARNKRLFGV